MPRLWDDTIEAHRQAVRDATLDATAALVARHGLRAVTMSQIAEATGIGRATLYKYFPDVDAILVAWHERQVAGHFERLVLLRDQARHPGARLEAVLEGYASIHHELAAHHAAETHHAAEADHGAEAHHGTEADQEAEADHGVNAHHGAATEHGAEPHRGMELMALLHRGAHVAEAQRHVGELMRGVLAEAAEAGAVRTDVPLGELVTYCLQTLAAAGDLPSKAAVRRLVKVTLAGLRPPG